MLLPLCALPVAILAQEGRAGSLSSSSSLTRPNIGLVWPRRILSYGLLLLLLLHV